jgi:glycosyltransferase involved in cell wall biosynthesis
MTTTQTQLPKISIGIPTFNRRDYVLEAIHSALAQTYANVEIIVSDNASTDDTWQHLTALADPRLVLLRQTTNLGMTGNFNATLSVATGEYFLLLSDDDLLAPTAIEELAAPFLEADSNTPGNSDATSLGVVWCPCTIIDSSGKALWDTAAGPAHETSLSLIENLWLGHRGPRLASVLERTADARSVGGFDQARFGLLCDTGNWGQVALRYPNVACVPRPLVQYRVHPSSGTGSAVCRDWQRWGVSLHAALTDVLRSRGDQNGVRSLERLRKPLLANLTVDVLMRGMGTPGWIGRSLPELWHSRSYLFTPYCFRRFLRDGAKLFR